MRCSNAEVNKEVNKEVLDMGEWLALQRRLCQRVRQITPLHLTQCQTDEAIVRRRVR